MSIEKVTTELLLANPRSYRGCRGVIFSPFRAVASESLYAVALFSPLVIEIGGAEYVAHGADQCEQLVIANLVENAVSFAP